MSEFVQFMVENWGAFGVGLLMFIENVFPPIPSELVMPLAGYAASRGEASFVGVVAGGVAGSLAGAAFWYAAGWMFGKTRLIDLARRRGRWLTLTTRDIERVDAWFDRHGAKAVLFGRLVPGVRTLISIPAALSGMSWSRFLLYSTIGITLWTGALAAAGYWLGETYAAVGEWLSPVSNGVVGVLVVVYLYRVATFDSQTAE